MSPRHLAEFPSTVLLIPLTRFPGFVWMIAVGLLCLSYEAGYWASAQTTS